MGWTALMPSMRPLTEPAPQPSLDTGPQPDHLDGLAPR